MERKYTKTAGDRIFNGVLFVIMAVLIIAVLYPFFNAAAISLNDSQDTLRGGITFFPRKFTLENYRRIFRNPIIYRAYGITIARTVSGTLISLLFTGIFAYGMSKSYIAGHKFYNILSIVPMYISGGMIPTFLLISKLGLIDNFLVYILPSAVGIWNMVLMRTFFRTLPPGLEESARIDGAGHYRTFFSVVLPVSAPIIATIALFNAVYQWNAWFDAAVYVTDQNLKPIQSVLISIVNEARAQQELLKQGAPVGATGGGSVNERSLTMGTMIITIIPILVIYPFIQKYFVKGMMVGSMKG